MPTSEHDLTTAELPDYLDDTPYGESPAGTQPAKTGLLRFARMSGVLDRGARCRAVDDRLPQCRLLPTSRRRARGR